MAKIDPTAPCPCGSGLIYKECCGQYHGGKFAPTPEALMRSRFSGYALNQLDYIMLTTHPDHPQYRKDRAAWRKDLLQFTQSTVFAGLKILNAEGNTVTFHAILFQDGEDTSYVERSRFEQHEERWKYHSGERLSR
ncbi:MAG TPA: YchJ family metal-binding protein [Phototrophicaceae bacterium]|jgi:SEC-C motif-containing protein|nr:YchJ family metal-binding protein [Phototrophicaceae bacterium]